MMADRSRAQRRLDRPVQILEAAFEEFVEHGYAATRLEDVAARAGVTKGTIYFYFENKEQVFASMVREVWLPVHKEVTSFLQEETGDSEKEFLCSFLRFLHQALARDRRASEIFRLLIAEARRFPELLDEHYARFAGPVFERLAQTLKQGAARGEFRNTALPEFAEVLIGPALTLNVWSLLFADRKPVDLDRHFEATIDLVLRGLLPR
jgi:AcrR family transcriptional regulator